MLSSDVWVVANVELLQGADARRPQLSESTIWKCKRQQVAFAQQHSVKQVIRNESRTSAILKDQFTQQLSKIEQRACRSFSQRLFLDSHRIERRKICEWVENLWGIVISKTTFFEADPLNLVIESDGGFCERGNLVLVELVVANSDGPIADLLNQGKKLALLHVALH